MNRIVLVFSALLLPGCPDCDYESRCDGDTVKTCSVGVDQLVGDPDRGRIPCEGENPVCVNLDDDRAQCVRAGEPTCADDFEPRCEGDVAVRCHDGYEVAEDCAAAENVCVVVEGQARCALPPLTTCDPRGYVMSCDGDGLVVCDAGVVSRQDCTVHDPWATCVVHRSEYGRSAYCGQE